MGKVSESISLALIGFVSLSTSSGSSPYEWNGQSMPPCLRIVHESNLSEAGMIDVVRKQETCHKIVHQ